MLTEGQTQAEACWPRAYLTYLCTQGTKISDWLSQFGLRLSVTCSPRYREGGFTIHLSKGLHSLLKALTLSPDAQDPMCGLCVLCSPDAPRTAVTPPVNLMGIRVPSVTFWLGLVFTFRFGKPGLQGLGRPY